MVAVGIGSRLMQDDAIGVLVTEHLHETLEAHGIPVVIAETDVEFGLEAIRGHNRAVIIDAVHCGKAPGEITVFPFCDLEIAQDKANTQHEATLIDCILRRQDANEGYLIGIEIVRAGCGYGLSERLSLLFEDICADVEQIVLSFVQT